jgi:protein-arginine kinase activator protein McsA
MYEKNELSKICNKCQIELPLVSFQCDNTKKDGRRTVCRNCCAETKRKYAKDRIEIIIEQKLTEKTCSKCEVTQSIDNFIKHLSQKDGYTPQCNTCRNTARNELRAKKRATGERYKCTNCPKDFSRKDQVIRHMKSCVTV